MRLWWKAHFLTSVFKSAEITGSLSSIDETDLATNKFPFRPDLQGHDYDCGLLEMTRKNTLEIQFIYLYLSFSISPALSLTLSLAGGAALSSTFPKPLFHPLSCYLILLAQLALNLISSVYFRLSSYVTLTSPRIFFFLSFLLM